MAHHPTEQHRMHTEEHELPCIEAVLAGTLALMTGHSQALQADLHPQQRLAMGAKVADNLALLGHHPMLSAGFRDVLLSLQQRWHAMGDCNRQAACEALAGSIVEPPRAEAPSADAFRFAAPQTLQ